MRGILLLLCFIYECFKFSIIFYMLCYSAIGKYFENSVQLRVDFMQADCWDWCLTSTSAFHNIAKKDVPNYSCKLLTVCALVKGVFICDCGKYNVTQVEVAFYIGEEGWCYFSNDCGYKGAFKSGMSDIFRNFWVKFFLTCVAEGCVCDTNPIKLVTKKSFSKF